jgi:hypothetical protein
MANDPNAGLGTMLNFLQQGMGGGGSEDSIPQLSGPPAGFFQQAPQVQQPSSGGGALSGILGNLASSFLSNKLNKYQDKQDAKEMSDAYAPVMKKMASEATNERDKKHYTELGALFDTRHPALVGMGLAAHKKDLEEQAQLTNEQRNLRDPELHDSTLAGMNNKGIPTMHTMGMPGKEGYKTNFYLDKNNVPVQVGEPFKEGAGVNVNMGAPKSWIMPTDAEKMVDKQGRHPPVGTEWGSPEARGYDVSTTQNQTDIKQQKIAGNLVGELNSMLFDKSKGLYKDYGPNTEENKVKQTVVSNVQKFTQTDPRYKNADDYINSNLAPAIKALGTAGSLSDSDVVRAQGLLPVITGVNIDTPQVAKEKLSKLTRLVNAASSSTGQQLPSTEVDKIISGGTKAAMPEGWNDDLEQKYQQMLKSRGK